ncbi:MAG: PTS sugar transporter subunit IIB [Pseudomonadota bacterium]
MPLVLVRVDCRLVHGQVLEAWLPFTKADCLVVANDQTAEDSMQRMIMKMAVPPDVEVAILGVQEAARHLSNGRWADKRVLLLLADLQDALASFRAGVHFDRLNLGNTICSPGKTPVNSSVSLDDADLDIIKELRAGGTKIEIRPLPREPVKGYRNIIESFSKR